MPLSLGGPAQALGLSGLGQDIQILVRDEGVSFRIPSEVLFASGEAVLALHSVCSMPVEVNWRKALACERCLDLLDASAGPWSAPLTLEPWQVRWLKAAQ